jgi:hypothetical protein
MVERRRLAEQKMQERIQHLQRVQTHQKKHDIQMLEEQEKMNEVKKQEMIENLKKK